MSISLNNKIFKRFIIVLIIILIIFMGGYLFLQLRTYSADEQANEAMQSSSVSTNNNTVIFEPENALANLVLYQGALVEPEAYAVFATMLQNKGIRVFIPEMPLNLAILNTSAFEDIKDAHPSEKQWWIGGHSLGGASASIYASENIEAIDGIFFLASYPSSGSDLSHIDQPVISLHATNDDIIDYDNYQDSMNLLPPHTNFIEIEGGNHSNFAHYGFQSGDGESTITREEQLDKVVQTLIDHIID
ncbi:Alpha/beta hydrolase family protein [Pelagirhabdus alkalitolerans]|uniref:Alpha/beta hydrolase family protein n=1 Tax=Pelagirhabdus alkalitolerans TaxID=1612202 RepID=A0A1G6MQR0_9BACI|nr:alpha/beta hydrolase [Pelagirhabdus alkalitolerans]SDC57842.1 Alpha/beta hydrolase family protein [Pelagirhabdus alkalitolerans]